MRDRSHSDSEKSQDLASGTLSVKKGGRIAEDKSTHSAEPRHLDLQHASEHGTSLSLSSAHPPLPPDMQCSQSKDSSHTHLHLHKSHHADLLEDFTRTRLPHEEIYVPLQHQPPNPEDEDDVVPNEHAAFGIPVSYTHLTLPTKRIV